MKHYMVTILIATHAPLHTYPPDHPLVPEEVCQAIHEAITKNDTDCICDYVITKGYNINDMWYNGRLPIHTAWQQFLEDYEHVVRNIRHAETLYNNTKDIFRLLVTLGARVHALDAHDQTILKMNRPLDIQRNTTARNFVDIFFQQLENLEAAYDQLFDDICKGHLTRVRSALEHSTIKNASQTQRDEWVEVAVPHIDDARTPYENWSLVHLAVAHKQLDILYLLLSDPDIRQQLYTRDMWGNRPLNLVVEKFTHHPAYWKTYEDLVRALMWRTPPSHRQSGHESKLYKIKKEVDQLIEFYTNTENEAVKKSEHVKNLLDASEDFVRIYEFAAFNPPITNRLVAPLTIRRLPPYDEAVEAGDTLSPSEDFSPDDINLAVLNIAEAFDRDEEDLTSENESENNTDDESTNVTTHRVSLRDRVAADIGLADLPEPPESTMRTHLRRQVSQHRSLRILSRNRARRGAAQSRLRQDAPTNTGNINPGYVARTFNPQLPPIRRRRTDRLARDHFSRLLQQRYPERTTRESDTEDFEEQS